MEWVAADLELDSRTPLETPAGQLSRPPRRRPQLAQGTHPAPLSPADTPRIEPHQGVMSHSVDYDKSNLSKTERLISGVYEHGLPPLPA